MIDNIAIEQNGLKKRKRYLITKEFLEENYIKLKKSSRAIAEELNIEKGVILRKLKKFGIKPHKGTGNHTKDLTNKKYYYLKVVSKSHKDENNRVYWNCKCECGNDVIVLGNSLVTNHTKSCGCRTKKSLYRREKYFGEISGTQWSSIKRCAAEKGREFKISQEYAWNLFIKQNRKCALSGVEITMPINNKEFSDRIHTASLDRIDSSKGYVEGNVQWVHKKINQIKMDLPQEEFVKLCELVYNNNYQNLYRG